MIHASMNRLCPKVIKEEIIYAKENIFEDLHAKEMKQTFPHAKISEHKVFAKLLVIFKKWGKTTKVKVQMTSQGIDWTRTFYWTYKKSWLNL